MHAEVKLACLYLADVLLVVFLLLSLLVCSWRLDFMFVNIRNSDGNVNLS